MIKKCKKCGQNMSRNASNNLCQKCYSSNREKAALKSGLKFPYSSETLIDRYIIKKMTMTSIVNEFKVSRFKVRNDLIQFGIPIRSKFKKFDENIFKKMSAQSTFLLGFIFTDGDFLYNENNKQYFLRIYSKHKSQIEKIKTIFKTDAKIQHRKKKKFGDIVQGEIYFLHIGNQSIISDLMSFGLTIYKNVDVKFPEIPNSLKHHFIRGCWAGSGSVSIYKDKVYSSIIIGSYDFIVEIEKFLNENGFKQKNIHKQSHSKKSSYLIKYAHSESEELYSFLYRGKTNLTISDKQEKIYKHYFKRKGCNQNS